MNEEMKTISDKIFKVRNGIRQAFMAKYPNRENPRRKKWRSVNKRLGDQISKGQGWETVPQAKDDLIWVEKMELVLNNSTPDKEDKSDD